VWGQPIFFTIDAINSCNFRCIYYPQSDQEHHFINGRGIMSLEDFKRVIANLWNGERRVALRRALIQKRPEDINICKACDVPWHGSYSGRTSLEKVRNFFFAGAWRR